MEYSTQYSANYLADYSRAAADRFRWGKIVLQTCLTGLICLSILAPPIPTGGTLPFLKAEQVLIPILGLLYVWLLMAGMVPMFRVNGMFLIGILFTFCVLLSTWFGAVVLDQNVVTRDFYEIPKLWFPVAFFTMAYESRFGEPGLRRLFRAFGFATLLVCAYAWGQWRDLPFTQTLNAYFSGGIHDEALLLTKRVYSTMGNPNVLGLLLSWAMAGFVLALLAKIGNRLWTVLIILSSMITIAMTASRYALLTTTAGIIMALVLALFNGSFNTRKRKVPLGLLFFTLSLVGSVAFQVIQSNPHAVSRYQDLKQLGQVDSLRQRVDDLWIDALTDFARSPILGFGPAKTRFSGIVTDSEFLDVLKQFGVVGFTAYLCFFLYPLSFLWRGIRAVRYLPPASETELKADVLVVRFTFIMAILGLLMNIGASTFYNPFLQGFLWLWLGVGARAAVTICSAADLAPVRSDRRILRERSAQDVLG